MIVNSYFLFIENIVQLEQVLDSHKVNRVHIAVYLQELGELLVFDVFVVLVVLKHTVEVPLGME